VATKFAPKISVRPPSEGPRTATLIARDEHNDLTVIRTNKPLKAVATFREGTAIRAGDAVVVLGYPLSGCGTLVTVRVPEGDQERVEAILDRSAVNIRDREMAYRKSGWSSFDPDAPPYTADQVRKERDLHRRNAA
jgi:S1-C subfamily serine protease